MTFVRWFLGKIILFLDATFSPTPQARGPEEQQRLQAKVSELSLYQFEACPFCVKVRRFLRSEGVVVPLRDATKEPHRKELLQGGGKLQVPCLRIPKSDGSAQWMYESADIIAYLKTLNA